jgi:ABC-type uncharacterized transport system permease subunit
MSAIEIIFLITIINSFSFLELNTFFFKNIIGNKSHILISSSIVLLSAFAIISNVSNFSNFIYLLCFANLYLIYGNLNLLTKNKLENHYLATIIYNFILIFCILNLNQENFNFKLIKIHVIFSFISYSILTVTFMCCLFVLFIEKNLQNFKYFDFLSNFPSILEIEKIVFYSFCLGLSFLVISLITGITYLINSELIMYESKIKIASATFSFSIFSTLLVLKLKNGVRGSRFLKFFSISYAFLLSSFIISIILFK